MESDYNDVIKITKYNLSKILKDRNSWEIINNAVFRTNNIVSHTYNFLKLYILYIYKNKLDFPIIDKNFIETIMIRISKRNSPKGRISNNPYKKDISEFYINHYKDLITDDNIVNNDLLSYILNYESDDILKNIKTNIKEHYVKHLTKYIKNIFKIKHLIDSINKKVKDVTMNKELKQSLYNDIKNIISDILNINNNYKSSEIYHEWLTKNKYKLIPNKDKYSKSNILYDLAANPLDYLKNFIYINKKLEKISKNNENIKLFNILPLRKSLISSSITLDTPAIINLLHSTNNELLKNYSKLKNEIWSKFFKLDKKIFKRNNYTFNYMIKTDGISVSILFRKVINNIPIKLSFAEQLKQIKFKEDKTYIEHQKNIKELIGDKNYVVIDPNKHDIIYCMDKNGVKFKYSQGQRNLESKSKKYKHILEEKKKTTVIDYENNFSTIKEIESKLSEYNSKTVNFKLFKNYIKIKNKMNALLTEYYQEKIHRKLKLNRYINTRRSEDNMINNFKNNYGTSEETIVIMGDFDEKGNNMKNHESIICKHIRTLFKRAKYKFYNINEYHTSKLCNKCECEVNKNFYTRKNEKNPVWGLVCCTNNNCVQELNRQNILLGKSSNYNKRILNRDTNAVLNMLKIMENLILTNNRPEKYIRNT